MITVGQASSQLNMYETLKNMEFCFLFLYNLLLN